MCVPLARHRVEHAEDAVERDRAPQAHLNDEQERDAVDEIHLMLQRRDAGVRVRASRVAEEAVPVRRGAAAVPLPRAEDRP